MKLSIIKTIIIISFFFISQKSIIAQAQCNDGYLSTPDVFLNYSKKSFLEDIYHRKIDLRTLKSQSSSSCWVVYSDRDNNGLYYTKGGMEKTDKLTFMEQLVVKEVNAEWLLVYSRTLEKNGVVENDVERGWIKAENLILSNKAALLNAKSSTKKAMILVTVSNLDPTKMNEYKDELKSKKFYNRPSNSNEFYNGRSAKKFKIYYILKELQNMVLLSSTDKLSGSTELIAGGRVPGWMPKVNITNWDHRVCLEPNYGTTSVREYGERQIPIFTDKIEYINDFIQNGDYTTSKAHIIKYVDIEKYRQDPYVMRMPILSTYTSNTDIKNVASIASMESKKTQNNIVGAQKKLIKLKNALNNVDILFVVDATQSMSKYYSAISKSIKNIISNNKLSGTNSNLRFGLAIYRDYADGEDVFEIQPLTSDYELVLNKVETTVCKSNDKDIPEAQYQGLINGIQKAGFNKNHSNIVVLIGDAGNHSPDPKSHTVKDVISEMNKNNTNLIAFQVIAGSDNSFTQFNWDAQDYLYGAAKMQLTNNTKVKLVQLSLNSNIKNTYKLSYGSNDNNAFRMFGRFTYATGHSPMSTSILEKNINGATSIYLKKIQNEIRLLENILSGEGGKNGEFTPEFISYLKRMGFTEEQIKLLMSLGEISSKGNTSIKYFNKSSNCFYPVVFLSYDEKENLNDILKKLRAWGGVGSKKTALKNALTLQAMEMLGAPKDVVESKTMNEVWDIILGVPFNGDMRISKIQLRDINKLDDNIFEEFYQNFYKQADEFRKNTFSGSMFEMAGQKFYWIPLDKFPGNE